MVIEESQIDHGPDWREIGPNGKSKRRAGPPQTDFLHDKGLSTEIGFKDRYGQRLSGQKARKFHRLRRHQNQLNSKRNRNLRYALGEIHRMCSALGLPKSIKEIAIAIHRRAVTEDLLQGRSIESMAAAALYAAGKIGGSPRRLGKVQNVARTHTDSPGIKQSYSVLNRQLNLEIPVLTPQEYLSHVISELATIMDGAALPVPEADLRLVATRILDVYGVSPETYVVGKNPENVATAATYLALKALTDSPPTQQTVADAGDCTPVTLRTIARAYPSAYAEAESKRPTAAAAAPEFGGDLSCQESAPKQIATAH